MHPRVPKSTSEVQATENQLAGSPSNWGLAHLHSVVVSELPSFLPTHLLYPAHQGINVLYLTTVFVVLIIAFVVFTYCICCLWIFIYLFWLYTVYSASLQWWPLTCGRWPPLSTCGKCQRKTSTNSRLGKGPKILRGPSPSKTAL